MNLKHNVRIATWNVQTLLRPGSTTLLSYELSRYNISIAGLCESRWPGSGECSATDYAFIWSGPTDGRGLYGVALAMLHRICNSLVSWSPVSDRILTARFLHSHGKITIIVAYWCHRRPRQRCFFWQASSSCTKCSTAQHHCHPNRSECNSFMLLPQRWNQVSNWNILCGIMYQRQPQTSP